MSLKKINAALVTAYQAVGLGLPTAYEMRDFRPPASGIWARVLNAPASRAVKSLGIGGEDDITGFFQIDLFVPEDSGTAAVLEPMDKLHNYFRPGRRFTYDGQTVRVRRTALTPARRSSDSASYRSTVTVYWNSPTVR